MKRVCLFAGYDSKGIIHDYVVYYLKELSTVSDVYYMADNEISDIEKEKIKQYTKGAYGFNHKKYDFGSWQELIKIIGWEKLYEYDELILANDSVFGPLYPMKEFFDVIEKDKEWDVCGINRGVINGVAHLSSYFIVFKNKVFITDDFIRHIENVDKERCVDDVVIKYEVPFMKKFYSQGYIVKSVLQKDVNIYEQWKDAVEYGSPFIKVKGLLYGEILIKDLLYIKNKCKYPVRYIISKMKKRFLIDMRKKLIQVNIKKDRFTVRLFGIYLVRKEPQKKEIKIYDYDKENCPIKVIGR